MRVAKSAACLPDITLQDLGTLDLAGAHRAFEDFPWADNLRKTAEMDANGVDCVNPDITFGIAPFSRHRPQSNMPTSKNSERVPW
jgi:hypothetical protein